MSRADGLWGTLVVRDPVGRSEEKLLPAHKWDHAGRPLFRPRNRPSWFISRHSLGFKPAPDNIIINGCGTFDCTRLLNRHLYNCSSSQQHATVLLEKHKTHRLRLVNVGSVGHQTFSIDRHRLTVIEADGVVIKPYVTTRVSIAPGAEVQRAGHC